VSTYSTAAEVARVRQHSTVTVRAEPRWDLAFLGILAYLVIEYTRLGAMFPKLGELQVGKIAIGICAVGYVLYRLSGGKRSNIGGVDIALMAFLLASFLSACFARYQEFAWAGFADAVRWVVIFFLISRIVTNSWRLRVFVFLLLLLNLKLAQFVIRSYFAQRAFGRSEEFLSRHGVGAGSTGFFGNAGDLGVAMCVVWPLAGFLFFGERRKFPRLLLLVSSMFFLAAILLCGSRGALVAAAVTALAACVRNPRRLAATVMVLVLVLGVLFFLPAANKERLRSALDWENDPTASIRIELWRSGLKVIRDHPIIGVGPWNFNRTYAEYYASSEPNPAPWAPHSIYLQALSELGLVGTVPLLVLWVLPLRLNARTRKHLLASGLAGPRSFEYCLAVGLDLALVGFLVSGAFLTVLYYPHLWILLGLSVGLYTTCNRKGLEKAVAELESQRRSLPLASC